MIGSGNRSAPVSGSDSTNDGVLTSEPHHHFLHATLQSLLARQPTEHHLPDRKRERNVAEAEPRDLLDHVHLSSHVARAPRRHRHLLAVDVESEPAQPRMLLFPRRGESDELVGPLGSEADDRPRRQIRVHVDASHPLRVRELDDQLRRERRCLRGEMRIDSLFPAVRPFRSQPQTLRGAIDRVRLEVRGFEENVGRSVRIDAGLEAALDAGERNRPLCIGDQQVIRRQIADRLLERLELFAFTRAAHDDLPLCKRRVVERVQRIAEREHRVVRHVDDVRDRTHARVGEARAKPRRRRTDAHIAEQAADVARAAFGVLDAHVDIFLCGRRRIPSGRSREIDVVERRDLARETVDREQIGPVTGRFDDEHVFDQRECIDERRPRLPLVRQHHDPAVVGAEGDLVFGEDHPVRQLAAKLRRLERDAVRKHGAGKRDGDGCAGSEVPGTAHDLPRLTFADVDLAELKPIGVRVFSGLEHAPDPEVVEIAVDVGNAAPLDRLDLCGRDAEPLRQLPERHLERDVLAEPADRDAHQNWRSTRRSSA